MKKGAIIGVLALVAMLFSCEDDVNRYDKYVTYDRFVPSEYFNFRTSTEVTLNLNYGEAKMKMPISVYTSDPSVVSETTGEIDSLNEKLEPVFRGFTENDGTLSTKIQVPATYSTIYVANQTATRFAVREVQIVGVTATIDLSTAYQETRLATRAAENEFIYGFTAKPGSEANPYSISDKLGKWNKMGLTEGIFVDESSIEIDADICSRMLATLTKSSKYGDWRSNTEFCLGQEFTNVVTEEDDTEITLHFLYENAGNHNVLGYYYYKVGEEPVDQEAFRKLPKFIALPNVTWDEAKYAANAKGGNRADNGLPLTRGSAVNLRYYGPNGDGSEDTELFPKDVEIGWFLISDGFNFKGYTAGGETFPEGSINAYLLDQKDGKGVKKHECYKDWFIPLFIDDMKKENYLPYIFSNEKFSRDGKYNGFISLYDTKTNTVVYGVEDGDSESFADALFYVKATPRVKNLGWDEKNLVVKTTSSYYNVYQGHKQGVFAFEDLWPAKGDYDMNDVVINYDSDILVDDKNNIRMIVDQFTTVQSGASYTDGFGYELGISQGKIESVEIFRDGVSADYYTVNAKGLETSTDNSRSVIMLYNNQKQALGKTITVTITLKNTVNLKMTDLEDQPLHNPFIVAQSNVNAGFGRKEVHLPKKYRPTPYAGSLLSEADKSVDDCWYVSNPDEEGIQYPFALAIPYSDDFKNFVVPAEGVKISEVYPNFKSWSRSKGGSNSDWYKYPNK